MIGLAVAAGGRTEMEFVRDVLADHLRAKGVESCSRRIGRRGRKGGNVSVDRLAPDMANLYRSPRIDYVTSLVDLYGFRGRDGAAAVELERRINEAVGKRLGRDWDRSRVFAYVQQYEFEGLLFSDVRPFAGLAGVAADEVEALGRIRSQFPTPEDIDDAPETAPGACIRNLVPGYDKRGYGPVLALEIGLDAMREECPRFDAWVAKLESLQPRRRGGS